jgi:hypothetical protein
MKNPGGHLDVSLSVMERLRDSRLENPCVDGSIPPRATKNTPSHLEEEPAGQGFKYVRFNREKTLK